MFYVTFVSLTYLVMIRMFVAILDGHLDKILKEMGNDTNKSLFVIIYEILKDQKDNLMKKRA